MKRLILLTLISPAAFGCINLVDFAELAAGWQVTTDFDDLVTLAEHWLDGCIEIPDPNAIDSAETVTTYTLTEIDLDGQNCDQWQISSLPSTGTLFDIYGTTRQPLPTSSTASMGSNFTSIRQVPYTVKRGQDSLWYYTESETADAFDFKTQYLPAGLISDAATVTITKAAYVKDSLCFDRSGTVTIPDNDAIEFDSSFSFCCWIRPQARFGSIIKKRAATGPGIEIYIWAGYLVIEAENTSGEHTRVIGDPVTLNEWQSFYVTAGHATDDYPDGLPDPPFTNAESCMIGSRAVAQIDKLTWFNAKDGFSMAVFSGQDRLVYSSMFAPTDYVAQFRCDEAAGSSITDFVSGTLTGTLSGVTWQPDDRPRRDKYNMN